ncbi:hypothetical protein F5J12DRAFT_853926 [Pisolithus orientalis]|uniref:uncharacterized protein n=1 Tax=Pisolithus orientalis TaxID=936130 RepID=UPI00222512B7|nr:uncharacterized protein F5J12DRAFT_853926 [Pisolithus orientalis]KAI5996491.1 hypothetical protein F5J12DRAFT_853926 [Pisolithus orientalis]
MPQNLFSITIFFVTFRETLEAAIIVSVLLGLVNQIVKGDPDTTPESRSQLTGFVHDVISPTVH